MANTSITIDTSQVDRLVKNMKGLEKEVAEATRLALNRTVDYTITQTAREVSKHYAIKQSEVKESFKGGISKPSKLDLKASMTSTGHTLSFAHFPFTPQTNIIARSLGVKHSKARVRVKIKKENGTKISARGFVAHTGAKSEDKVQYNVFMRLGTERLPIAPIRTLSIPQMITNEKVFERIQKSSQEMLEKRLDHEITRIMKSLNKNISKK